MCSGNGPQATLLRFSIRFLGIVIALACVLLGYGLYTLLGATYDVFPEFAPPQIGIQTEAPGLAPEQVEILVTQPLENTINGVPALSTLRSNSIQGLSVITATFDPSSDIYRDRQIVAERLTAVAAELPSGVAPPVMTPLVSSASTVLMAGFTSTRLSLMDLRTIAEWTIRPRLLSVPGVAGVEVYGGEQKSLQIQVHPNALARYGMGLNDILSAARHATGIRGAGFIDTANQRIVLQSQGQSLTPQEIARTVVTSADGLSLTLGNVATVVDAPEPAIGAASINGQAGVVLNITEQYGANIAEVTPRLDTAFADLEPSLKSAGIALHADLFRPETFIRTATGNVRSSLMIGGALVVIVLFLFLFDLRTAAMSVIAIPLSLLAAVIVLQRFDITLNTMTLGGLAIAIGVVVDDAVVDVENIVRRLRENTRCSQPRGTARVVFDACLEVRGPVVYATFAVVLVVVPVVTLPGLAGRLFAPLGIAYALAVLASLLVTLTVVPALAMVLLTGGHLKPDEPSVMRWSKDCYRTILRRSIGRPRMALTAVTFLTLAACAMLPFFGGGFIPELKEGHFIVHMITVPGTSVAESLRIGNHVTAVLADLPFVRSVAQRAGRAELSTDSHGPHRSEFEVDLKPLSGEAAEAAVGQLRVALAGIPGPNFAVNTFLTERVDETISGYTAPLVANIFGPDLDLLDRKAQEVAAALRGVRGATDVLVQSPPGMPQLTLRLRQDDLERWGIDPVEALDAIRTAYQGDTVGQAYDGNRVFPVIVILDPASRTNIDHIGDLPLRTPSGRYVSLRQIADINGGSGRYQVLHQQAQRVQTVTSNVSGRDLTSFVRDAQAQIAKKVSLPPGTYIEFAGEAEAQSRSQYNLFVSSIVALVGIVLLLSVVTRNRNNLLLVLTNLPFAFVGGVFATFAVGGLLSLGSMVGFIALLGITLRNSILMIAHYEHLVGIEGKHWGSSTAIQGAADRLTPILMTSLVTALGVLPLAIGMNEPGREIEGPMAVVILGGLLSSLALNLLVLPTLALRYGRFEVSDARSELAEPPLRA